MIDKEITEVSVCTL